MKRALETHIKEHKAAIQEDNYNIVLLIIGTIAECQSVYVKKGIIVFDNPKRSKVNNKFLCLGR